MFHVERLQGLAAQGEGDAACAHMGWEENASSISDRRDIERLAPDRPHQGE